MTRLIPGVLLISLAGACTPSMPKADAVNAAAKPSATAMPNVATNGATIPFPDAMLPPGSKVTAMMVDAHKSGANNKTMIDFTAPVDPPHARDWFLQMLLAHDYKLTANGPNLMGHAKDGTPFRLDLKPAAGGGSTGTLTSG